MRNAILLQLVCHDVPEWSGTPANTSSMQKVSPNPPSGINGPRFVAEPTPRVLRLLWVPEVHGIAARSGGWFSQEIFDIPITQTESIAKLDGVRNAIWRRVPSQNRRHSQVFMGRIK